MTHENCSARHVLANLSSLPKSIKEPQGFKIYPATLVQCLGFYGFFQRIVRATNTTQVFSVLDHKNQYELRLASISSA